MTDIMPQVLRAVADWLDDGDRGVCTAVTFREEAHRLEREQADEQRIDELAQAFLKAAHPNASEWKKQPQSIIDTHRAGIRAVLYRIEQEEAGVQTSKVCGQIRPIGEPFRCSLREGHSGSHEAWAGNSTNRELCATWENA